MYCMTERKKVPNVPPKKTVYFVLCKVFIKMEEKTTTKKDQQSQLSNIFSLSLFLTFIYSWHC